MRPHSPDPLRLTVASGDRTKQQQGELGVRQAVEDDGHAVLVLQQAEGSIVGVGQEPHVVARRPEPEDSVDGDLVHARHLGYHGDEPGPPGPDHVGTGDGHRGRLDVDERLPGRPRPSGLSSDEGRHQLGQWAVGRGGQLGVGRFEDVHDNASMEASTT